MMPSVYASLNLQYQQGCGLAQQAMMFAASGNVMAAAQSFDQGLFFIGNSMMFARGQGIPVPDAILFTYAVVHYNAARVKIAMGFLPVAMGHLNESFSALSQAVAINPNLYQYHSAAGNVLLMLGDVPGAERAFVRALELNPMDPYSRWMLSFVHTARGNTVDAEQHYDAARQGIPGLPSVQQAMQEAGVTPPSQGIGGQGQPADALTTFSKVFDVADKFFTAAGHGIDLWEKVSAWGN